MKSFSRKHERWRGSPRAAVTTGSNDLIVSEVIRRNELQVWFVAEHVVNVPLTHASS